MYIYMEDTKKKHTHVYMKLELSYIHACISGNTSQNNKTHPVDAFLGQIEQVMEEEKETWGRIQCGLAVVESQNIGQGLHLKVWETVPGVVVCSPQYNTEGTGSYRHTIKWVSG